MYVFIIYLYTTPQAAELKYLTCLNKGFTYLLTYLLTNAHAYKRAARYVQEPCNSKNTQEKGPMNATWNRQKKMTKKGFWRYYSTHKD